jgi:DNA-binding response OmpR family regulator
MARILLIDDDAPVRTMLRLLLTHHGHTVVEAASGREGLRAFHDSPIDLAITDLVMPDVEGFEVLAELKKNGPEVKIIMITGGVRGRTANFLEMALRLGADKALAKPFAHAALLAAIDELIPPVPLRVPVG